MVTSQNGWPVLTESGDCAKWSIPVGSGETRHVFLRPGHVGFILACWILWFHRAIEVVNKGQWDEWGWAVRNVRGSTTVVSNHSSGTAVDINATQHPLGVRYTFNTTQARRIRWKLKHWYRQIIFWGGDYNYRPDEMHFEIAEHVKMKDCIRLARFLKFTPVGRAVYKANQSHYSSRWSTYS